MSKNSKRIEDLLVELKNTSEMMVDLAYSSLMYESKDIAARVIEMEEEMDKLHREFELSVLESGKERTSKEKLALIRIGLATERIADAATLVADIASRGPKTHSIFKIAIEESEKTILCTTIAKNSIMTDKSLGELGLEDDIGIKIIAIFRNVKWIYNPSDSFKLNAGDEIIARGYSRGRAKLLSLTNPKDFS